MAEDLFELDLLELSGDGDLRGDLKIGGGGIPGNTFVGIYPLRLFSLFRVGNVLVDGGGVTVVVDGEVPFVTADRLLVLLPAGFPTEPTALRFRLLLLLFALCWLL